MSDDHFTTGRTSEECRQDRALNAEMKRLWNGQTYDAALESVASTADSLMEKVTGEIMALPPRGKPAADLTERERLAVAIASGVSAQTHMEGLTLICRTAVPVAICDRGDGGYIVAVGPKP